MALTTVGLLGLVALQTIAIRGNMMSRNFAEAMGIAQSRIEQTEHTLYTNLSTLQEGGCAATAPPAKPNCDNAVVTNASPDPNNPASNQNIYSRCTVVTPDLTNNKTTVQVTVCWKDIGYDGVINTIKHAITLYTVRSP